MHTVWLVLALAGLDIIALPELAAAECSTNHPFPGVVCYSETRPDPPMRLFLAEVDLTNSNLRLRVAPGGPDPDGPGPWQTTLMTPTRIAVREGFDLVVNGDFFDARGVKDAEGTNSGFRAEIWAAVNGPAVTDGRIWATSTNARPCLIVHRDRKVTIERRSRPQPDDWEVVAGNTLLLEAGAPVPHQSKTRHPRTAAGLNAEGTRLILLVADGRKPGIAVGLSYEEEATELLRWGCRQALNLDGGGSSVMAIRDRVSGQFHILNQPTDGHERAVANALGISLHQ
jgi:exopolysaccharide biosynthesis protein